jgi:chaperone modulatory protein CbpM
MNKHNPITITIETNPALTLDELCAACDVTPEFIQELIAHGVIEPQGVTITTWRFDGTHLSRVCTVLRLQRHLEVNIPGAPLALDLMDEIEQLRTQIAFFTKHLT